MTEPVAGKLPDKARPAGTSGPVEKGKELQVAPLALPVPDDELVRRVQAGNSEAFEELVRRYERRVYNITYRLLGNEQDASEALQDAFLRAYRFIAKFEFKSSFFTWLYRIATNVSLSKLRKRPRVETISIDGPVNAAGDLPLEIPDEKYTPEKLMRQRELRAAMKAAVDGLPEDYRSVVVLRDLEGLTNEEAGKVLNLSVAAVKSRLHRGRLVLRTKLVKYL